MGFWLQTNHFLLSLDIFVPGNHVALYLSFPRFDDSSRRLTITNSYTIREPDIYHSSPNYSHRPRHIA